MGGGTWPGLDGGRGVLGWGGGGKGEGEGGTWPRRSVCYAAGGMPLPFTQEDFLFKIQRNSKRKNISH